MTLRESNRVTKSAKVVTSARVVKNLQGLLTESVRVVEFAKLLKGVCQGR